MAATIYAVLVGINEYLGVRNLQGCVNDVKRMREFLEARTQGGDYTLDARLLTSGDPDNPAETKPSRQAIIQAFQEHLTQADEGDIALFYYSGHGAQENAPPEFWHIEPDHLDETLVCYDSRTEGSWDLADKELAVLITQVAQKNPHILVILDSCHSGSGTRGEDEVRLATTDPRDRPLDSFLPGVLPAAQAAEGRGSGANAGDWFAVPDARHIVLAACRPEELAREKRMASGERRGVLSYFLLDTLQGVGPTLTYRDLFSRVATLVRSNASDQNPILEATDPDDLARPFLGGAIRVQQPYYEVRAAEGEWVLSAGAIHGIAQPVGGETTHLALFPLGRELKVGDDLADRTGTATVREVGGGESFLELEEGSALDEGETYKAVVVATPLAPVAVHLEGDDGAAREALRAALGESRIARVVENQEEAALRVVAEANGYRLKRAGDREPLAVKVQDTTEAVAKLEHMAQWLQLLNLDNPHTELPADAVRMDIYHYDTVAKKRGALLDPAKGIEVLYDPKTESRGLPTQLRLHHTGSYGVKLFCMVADLSDDFSVSTSDALFGGGVWLEPGEEVWATLRGQPFIYLTVPKTLRDKGITQVRDVLKLVVSTAESDANLLNQKALDVVKDEGSRGLGSSRSVLPPSLLHRLMNRFPNRGVGAGEGMLLSDWRTSQVGILTQVPGEGAAVPTNPAASVPLVTGGSVRLKGHRRLRAKARVVPFDQGKRDVGNLALPAVFRTYPDLAPPFDLLPSRSGGDAGASVVTLHDVTDAESVTPEEPLVFLADAVLGAGEAVLPVAWDAESELFLPLGLGVQRGDEVEIRVERLPAPTADSRDVKGSVKLFLQKVVAEKVGAERFGLDGKTARLAAATWENGRVVYDDSPLTLKQKVAAARRILLYVHGFTGDTRGMVTSAYGMAQPSAPLDRLVDRYDLLLAWDYENINTPIAETALLLKKALAEVGLGPQHGKTLHIVAHSMGCVVSRWFIEREGGNQVVGKAVLVGPPNAGTPLAKYQDYAMLGLGAALNGVTAIVWPPAAIPAFVGILGTVIGGVEQVDVTLDELKPGSSFYKQLNASDDPGIPYVVVAGNTSKILAANPEREQQQRNLLKKLADRLTSPQTRRKLADLAFFNHPNDLIISVESMISIPANRSVQFVPVEIACDHISYFSTEVGLRTLVDQLPAG